MLSLAPAVRSRPGKSPARGGVLLIEAAESGSALAERLVSAVDAEILHCVGAEDGCRLLDAHAEQLDLAVIDARLLDDTTGGLLETVVAARMPVFLVGEAKACAPDGLIGQMRLADQIVKTGDAAVDAVISGVGRLLANRGVRVLVVDDMTSARRLLVDLLRTQQFQVLEASTAREALDVLAKFPDVALVLTDYHMPDMNGHELTRAIREMHDSDKLRIIGVSSSSDRQLSATFLKEGADDFVYRPFVAEELKCRVNHNVQTLEQLHRLRVAALSDYLTELPNRRFFFDQGPKMISGSLHRGEGCCVAMLDIDHFKALNDTYGHDGGDRVLVTVAKRLRTLVGDKGHLLGRLGGEEFGFVLVGLEMADAAAFCETIKDSIAALRIVFDDQEVAITVSIGLAEVCGHETFDNYLTAADQYLYLAKNYGRNRVYSDLSMLTG